MSRKSETASLLAFPENRQRKRIRYPTSGPGSREKPFDFDDLSSDEYQLVLMYRRINYEGGVELHKIAARLANTHPQRGIRP